MAPKVSVIMPSLNVAPYIRECIESVIAQTLKDIEIICVDAGSDDGTLEILREYAAKDPRIRIIVSGKKSYGHQINIGIESARGEYIGIVETDDCIKPDMYETLAGIADRGSLEITKADYCNFEGDGDDRRYEYRSIIRDENYYNTVLDPFENDDVFKAGNVPWAGIYLASFLKDKKIRLNETPGASFQDNGLWWQSFTQAHRIMFYDKPFYMYRRDNPDSSFKSSGKVYCMCDEYDFIRDYLSRHPELEKRYAPLVARYRMSNYNFTLNRIAPEYQQEFLQRYAADFIKIRNNGELYRSLYTEKQWQRLNDIMECPEYVFYSEYFKPERVREQKEKVAALKKELRTLRKQRDSLQRKLTKLKGSKSYRICRAITWLPRRIRGEMQSRR